MTDSRRRTAEMVGAAIMAAIERQPPEDQNRLFALWIAGDWSLEKIGRGKLLARIGGQELVEITAGGPFAELSTLYQRGTD